MEMTKEEMELLRQQAIEANNQRIADLETFLEGFSLDTSVNKTVALELATAISFIEQQTEEMKNIVISWCTVQPNGEGVTIIVGVVYTQSFKQETFVFVISEEDLPMFATLICRDCGGTGVFEIDESQCQDCVICKGSGKEFVSLY